MQITYIEGCLNNGIRLFRGTDSMKERSQEESSDTTAGSNQSNPQHQATAALQIEGAREYGEHFFFFFGPRFFLVEIKRSNVRDERAVLTWYELLLLVACLPLLCCSLRVVADACVVTGW